MSDFGFYDSLAGSSACGFFVVWVGGWFVFFFGQVIAQTRRLIDRVSLRVNSIISVCVLFINLTMLMCVILNENVVFFLIGSYW